MEIVGLHRRAIAALLAQVVAVGGDDLNRPTPCADWDLGLLLAHLTDQHNVFADSVGDTSPPGPDVPSSAERLLRAFAAADPDLMVILADISETEHWPLPAAVGFQLLDTAVHTWDVAAALGRHWRPEPEIIAPVYSLALRIPDAEGREGAGAAFTHALPGAASDPWSQTLALLGRNATWTTRLRYDRSGDSWAPARLQP